MIFNPGDAKTKRPMAISILLAIVVLSVLMMALRLNEAPVGSNTDDAYYIEMARSIAEGLGPVLNSGPDVVAENPDIFPPGFPLLLSPLAKFNPNSIFVLKIVPVVFTLMLIPLVLLLSGQLSSNLSKLMTLALVMLNPWVIAWSGRVLSDSVYTVLSLGTLLLFAHNLKKARLEKWNLIFLVILSALTISTRTIGWSVVVVVVFFLVKRHQYRSSLSFLILVFLAMLPIWVFQSGEVSPITSAYWSQMLGHESSSLGPLMLHNFVYYLAELPVIMIPLFGGPAETALTKLGLETLYFPAAIVVGLGLIGLMSWGASRQWRIQKESPQIQVLVFYLIVYASVLMFFDGYPSGVQTRLLLPVLPILGWLIVIALQSAKSRNSQVLAWFVFVVMISSAFVHNGWRMANPLHSSVDDAGNGFVDLGVGASWIRENTTTNDVIMVQDTLHRHLHFYRNVVAFPEVTNESNLNEILEEYEVDYIFIGPSVHGRPRQLDEQGTKMLRLVRSMNQKFQMENCDTAENIFIFARTSIPYEKLN